MHVRTPRRVCAWPSCSCWSCGLFVWQCVLCVCVCVFVSMYVCMCVVLCVGCVERVRVCVCGWVGGAFFLLAGLFVDVCFFLFIYGDHFYFYLVISSYLFNDFLSFFPSSISPFSFLPARSLEAPSSHTLILCFPHPCPL